MTVKTRDSLVYPCQWIHRDGEVCVVTPEGNKYRGEVIVRGSGATCDSVGHVYKDLAHSVFEPLD